MLFKAVNTVSYDAQSIYTVPTSIRTPPCVTVNAPISTQLQITAPLWISINFQQYYYAEECVDYVGKKHTLD